MVFFLKESTMCTHTHITLRTIVMFLFFNLTWKLKEERKKKGNKMLLKPRWDFNCDMWCLKWRHWWDNSGGTKENRHRSSKKAAHAILTCQLPYKLARVLLVKIVVFIDKIFYCILICPIFEIFFLIFMM